MTERRARLAVRQGLLTPAPDVVAAADRVVCLHATDPATVFLSAWARVADLRVQDVERALYQERSLVRHMAMRRTLFVFPRATLGAAQAGASRRVADSERRRLIADVEKAELYDDGAAWLRDACESVLGALAAGRQATFAELRDELPVLGGAVTYGEGKSWGGAVPVGPRVLTVLSASGLIVRAGNDGGWTTSRPRWALMSDWLGEELAPADGLQELVARWLRAFGPGTVADLKWWLGSTVREVRGALAGLSAVQVDLDGEAGYLLADDLEPVAEVAPWAALLPAFDPTTMGWSRRDWYLGEHKPHLFDRSGNAGATAWWDGRIVGGWRQENGGEVVLQLLEDVGSEALEALEARAAALSEWLAGARVSARFPSPLSRQAVSWRRD